MNRDNNEGRKKPKLLNSKPTPEHMNAVLGRARLQVSKTQVTEDIIKRSTSREILISQIIKLSKKLKDEIRAFQGTTEEYFNLYQSITNEYKPTYGPIELIPENCITIMDLLAGAKTENQLGKPMLGKYMICRTVVWPLKHNAVQLVVEDRDEDKCIFLSLYNWLLDEEMDPMIIPIGTTLIIKNPSLQIFANGNLGIRVDNPAEVDIANGIGIYTNWKPLNLTYNSKYKEEIPKTRSPHQYKVKGNLYFLQRKFYSAIRSYTFGLSMDPKDTILLNNRSYCYLEVGKPFEALLDAELALGIKPQNVKAIIRKSLALARLGKFNEAIRFLKSKEIQPIVKTDSYLQSLLRGGERIGRVFHFTKMDSERLMGTYLHCVEYFGPLQVVQIPGKGRGMIAAKTIPKGYGILACRAFELIQLSPNTNATTVTEDCAMFRCDHHNTSICLKSECRRIVTSIALRFKERPELIARFYQLYAGPKFEPVPVDMNAQNKASLSLLIDMERISEIVHYNAFGCSVKRWTGIWIEPSYINHSCTPNTHQFIVGDFLSIYAVTEIPAGTEITLSYFDSLNLTYEKRKMITQSYGFVCTCQRCLKELKNPI